MWSWAKALAGKCIYTTQHAHTPPSFFTRILIFSIFQKPLQNSNVYALAPSQYMQSPKMSKVTICLLSMPALFADQNALAEEIMFRIRFVLWKFRDYQRWSRYFWLHGSRFHLGGLGGHSKHIINLIMCHVLAESQNPQIHGSKIQEKTSLWGLQDLTVDIVRLHPASSCVCDECKINTHFADVPLLRRVS